ncbi:cyclic peptide export ABC transporter [Pseudoalteromonas citrea]|uniref:Cyclic peptide export ABC transporter n=1 Tax=Pseudoalteromonas citrea TaxID=43655 RepID=A0A5S3XPI8_9GAMM|nr:cyclic peptide export ABC transporter [Pseudoalteromonas citrea]TMP43896.1 cyclic peptide export ABC transporter [Pseudoalteromonas citrea]TMP58545.1 cyclic peptide export ABC transporter [Pseudoalteromonas citrea]
MNKNKELTSLSRLLYNFSPRQLIFAVGLGMLSGALYSLIIPFILNGLDGGQLQLSDYILTEQGALGFFLFVAVILATKVTSVILVNNIAKSASADLKLKVARRIQALGVDTVERIGFSKILNILIDDVNRITSAAVAIPMMIVSVVTVLGMLTYLAYLDIIVFAYICIAIVTGVILFQMPVLFAKGLYQSSRANKDTLQEGIRGLIFGAYEMKLSHQKGKQFLAEEVAAPLNTATSQEKRGDAVIHLAGNASEMICFFVIGGVVFLLPTDFLSSEASTFGIVMALLYITGPIAAILSMVQTLKIAQVSLERVHQLQELEPEVFGTQALVGSEDTWQTLSLSNVRYQYQSDEVDDSFGLQPINLKLQKGNIYFIVGGNGSGKSTLSKLISFHYRPTHGCVKFDGTAVTESNLMMMRERVGVIFSNYHLFRKLYIPTEEIDQDKVKRYMDIFKLTGKTELVGNIFTTTKLSDGQKRRLALLVALMEDKEIYIFDEWAADQDPEFKEFFYTQVLPELKSQGKLIVAITHDDRYFHCADSVIKMESGAVKTVEDKANFDAHQSAPNLATA